VTFLEADRSAQALEEATGDKPAPQAGVVRSIPRRPVAESSAAYDAVPPMARAVQIETSWLRAAPRLGVWIAAMTRFAAGGLLDTLRGRRTPERDAERLRRILERTGPTFIKIGQQLSLRADLFPSYYCEELADITDVAPAFDTAIAIARIEEAAGRRLQDVFAVFDPTPIASTTVACVYQALLPSGEKVGVKVRRPGIGDVFAADLRALGWLLSLGEACSFLRPGRSRDLCEELRLAFSESLNYSLEARYNEIFSRRARRKQQDHIQAPKVYFELSSEEVLVTEFVSGVFLWEILEAIERRDEAALAEIKARGIDPMTIAQHLTRSFYWEALENIFFHADPHPTKIVARPDNSLVFIDFASCGRFSEKIKRYYQQLQAHITREDVSGMVDATISMLEPLPPIDLERFTRDIEALYWDWLYATKSRHAAWWERATGELWVKVLDVARRYKVPVNLDILRMFRATFLYDSVAMRLWDGLNLNREYRAYSRERGRRARRRIRRSLRRRMERGPTRADYLALQDFGRLLTQIMNRGQHFLDSPAHRFAGMIGKAAFGVSITLRIVIVGASLHVFGVVATSLFLRSTGRAADMRSALSFLVYHPAYQLTIALVLLIVIRRTLIRLEDIDVERT
jgi:ubiquinone biosynthesis protein